MDWKKGLPQQMVIDQRWGLHLVASNWMRGLQPVARNQGLQQAIGSKGLQQAMGPGGCRRQWDQGGCSRRQDGGAAAGNDEARGTTLGNDPEAE